MHVDNINTSSLQLLVLLTNHRGNHLLKVLVHDISYVFAIQYLQYMCKGNSFSVILLHKLGTLVTEAGTVPPTASILFCSIGQLASVDKDLHRPKCSERNCLVFRTKSLEL